MCGGIAVRDHDYRTARVSDATLEVCEPAPALSQVTEGAWEESQRRSQVIRELYDKKDRTLSDAVSAAAQLGCSVSRVYVLLKRFRDDPTVTGLLNRRSGPLLGTTRLSPAIEALVDDAIETTYLSKQKIRLVDLIREIRRRCRSSGVV